MSGLQMLLFGPPRVERDGAMLHFERHKTLALLAYLAVTGQAHGRDVLAALLWPEVGPSQARANLRRARSHLRQLLGPGILDRQEDRVALNGSAIEVDVGRFRACLAQVEAHHHAPVSLCADCLTALTEAAELGRDDFLAGFALRDAPDFDAWQTFQTESLRLELAGALEKLALAHGERGDLAHAIPHARRWLALDPLCEPAHRCLMRLHAAAGDRAAAFAQYEACQKALQEELGIPPEPETTALCEQLKASVTPLRRTGAPGKTPAGRAINNLPVAGSAFIGREIELAQVAERLADPACRLLTVLGPGGIGKTRLVLEAGRNAAILFPHGVCFVDLTAVPAAELLSGAILHALDVTQHAEPDQQLLDLLKDKNLLLVLDNYEHLLTGPDPDRRDGYGLATRMIATAAQLKLLLTSRAAQRARRVAAAARRIGDATRTVHPRSGRDGPRAARARSGGGTCTVREAGQGSRGRSRGSARSLRRDCPLPGLSAAPPTRLPTHARGCTYDRPYLPPAGRHPTRHRTGCRVDRVLSLDEIARRLEHGLDLLTTTLRGVPSRQRSMTATFDYSWRLLTPRERSILRQLSVFRGGFTGAAAEAVTGAMLTDLATLADASWLRSPAGERYTLHELVRQYCTGKLESEHEAETGESADQVRKRHAGYYNDLVHDLCQRWFRGLKPEAGLGTYLDNLIAAWDWVLARDELEIAWGVCHGLGFLGDRLGRQSEAARMLESGVRKLRVAQAADHDEMCREARAVVLAIALASLSERFHYLTKYDDAAACLEEARNWLDQVAARDERWAEAHWFYLRGLVYAAYDRGDYPVVTSLGQQSLAELRAGRFCPYSGDISNWLPEAHMLLGWSAARAGEYENARSLAEQACAIAEASGSDFTLGFSTYLLGWALFYLGEYAHAEQAAQRMVTLADTLNDALMQVMALETQACVEFALGRHDRAASILRRNLTMAREAGMQYSVATSLVGLADIELALGHPAAARRLYEMSAGPPGTPVVLSALIGLGRVALSHGHNADARAYFRQALLASGYKAVAKAEAILFTAEALYRAGESDRGTELCGFLMAWRGAPAHVHEMAQKLLRDIESRLPAGELAAAVAHGRSRQLDDVLAEIVEGGAQPAAPFEIVTT